VNPETPHSSESRPEPDTERLTPPHADVYWSRALPPRPKFQHNYRLHLLLFALTFITTTWTAAPGLLGFVDSVLGWQALRDGLLYSLPLLTILTAHEFGHYLACRYYNVDASLPYYLPFPLGFAGTLGAVIRIREAFPSKKALFDIGVAGPIAGFVALIPFLLIGLSFSEVRPVPPGGYIYFAEPPLWKLLEFLYFGVLPAGTDVFIHPMAFAAWWGMFATFLNLLPFGQMDGGHLAYAVLGRRATYVSAATLATLMLLSFKSLNWIVMAVLMLAASYFFGFGHPRVIDEDVPLDSRRQWVAALAVVMFILCCMPVPISFEN
jgi:membrane-associated protease RseP (regulator of RpoE activity)